MKNIYIVLAHTGTLVSEIIKKYTNDEFSHVSLSLDIELNHMYSFGRLNPYNPVWGGFVQEYIHKGTFKRFYNTQVTIYSLQVTDKQYKKLSKIIERFEKHKKKYTFNIVGMFAVGINKKIGDEYSFYCAEFVRYLLKKARIRTGLPKIIRPEDFKNINGITEIYSGKLQEYKIKEIINENKYAK